MVGKINVEDLLPETKHKLKLGNTTISPKLIALGKILITLEALTPREALWSLRTATNHIKGYRERGKRA